MEEQVPPSNFLPNQQPIPGQITPEQLEQLKARAREAAIMQIHQQQQAQSVSPVNQPGQIIYVKRSLTVAEIMLLLLMACGIVFGGQLTFNFVANTLPRIEIKMK